MSRPRIRPKNRDRKPGAREAILAACLTGLAGLSGAKVGQSAPSTIHVLHRGVDFEVTIFERARRKE